MPGDEERDDGLADRSRRISAAMPEGPDETPITVADPFQVGDAWTEEVRLGRADEAELGDELMKRQGGKCGGCQIPLSSIGFAGRDSDLERSKVEEEAGKQDSPITRMGWVYLRTPRRLKGKEVPSNQWLLCTQCLGSTTVNIRLPNWLLNKSKDYRKKNSQFKYITQLMRAALEHYISSEDEQKEKMAEVGRELELSVAKWIGSMPEQLTRFSSADFHVSGAAFEAKSENYDSSPPPPGAM